MCFVIWSFVRFLQPASTRESVSSRCRARWSVVTSAQTNTLQSSVLFLALTTSGKILMDCRRLKGNKEEVENWGFGHLYLLASRCHSYRALTLLSTGFQIDTPDLILSVFQQLQQLHVNSWHTSRYYSIYLLMSQWRNLIRLRDSYQFVRQQM